MASHGLSEPLQIHLGCPSTNIEPPKTYFWAPQCCLWESLRAYAGSVLGSGLFLILLTAMYSRSQVLQSLSKAPQHCGVLVTPGSKSEIGINDCIRMLSLTSWFVIYQKLNHLTSGFLDNYDFSHQNSFKSTYLESLQTDIHESILVEFLIIFRIIW